MVAHLAWDEGVAGSSPVSPTKNPENHLKNTNSGMFYKTLIRPVLFLFPPEGIHNFTFLIIKNFLFIIVLWNKIFIRRIKREQVKINELCFRNPLGVAAGLDKNGEIIKFWEISGFSHVEVGTVTPKPQAGNPKPRIFRIVKDNALINSMGFNNKGADKIRENIIKAKKKCSKDFVIGVNIGKNRDTPLEKSFDDYVTCMNKLYDVADYFTINISSPNTEGLRDLQGEEYLDSLLMAVKRCSIENSKKYSVKEKNIFVKISPDLSEEEVRRIYRTVLESGIDGIIATNTTLGRDGLSTNEDYRGGLSGKPLQEKSDNVLRILNEMNSKSERKVFLIGSGGVFGMKDFQRKREFGAALVQVYTGFIYEGKRVTKL